MNITGIIAEYNPFHGGHYFHIEEAKKRTDADYCIAVMSGDFVQRGEPAVFDKYLRTKMALTGGADLVIELPSVFAVSSAEDFAACGVRLLSRLGAVTHLCFGSENGDLDGILAAAKILADESPDFSARLREGLKLGLSWPQARNRALLSTDVLSGLKEETFNRLLKSPNNLLGIEYCKAIFRCQSPLRPVTIQRKGQGYHDETLDLGQASASAVRKDLLAAQLTKKKRPDKDRPSLEIPASLTAHIPAHLLPLYSQGRVLGPEDCAGLLNYRLLSLFHEKEDLTVFADVSRELADRLAGQLLQYEGWEGRIRQLKTKQYTYTRISRCLTHILLGITDAKILKAREMGYAPYARILGSKKGAGPLLSLLKKQSEIPLITKTANASQILTEEALTLFKQDLFSSHVRQSIETAAYGRTGRNEFNQPVCII